MVTYRDCSGCRYFRTSVRGLKCVARHACARQRNEQVRWMPVNYATPEDGQRKETR